MPTTQNDLDALFAAAGRALAQRREDAARRERERREEDRRRAEQHVRAAEHARTGAPAVFAWVEGEEAEALRARMRSAALDLVPLSPWISRDGRTRERPCSFSWRAYLPSDAGLVVEWVGSIGAGMGHGRQVVSTPAQLVDVVPPGVVVRLAEEVRSGHVMEHVAAGLKEIR
jgi:hypothetical protein